MCLMLPDLSRQGPYDAFLRQNSVFLIINALLDALLVATDFELVMLTPGSLSLAQSVQIF